MSEHKLLIEFYLQSGRIDRFKLNDAQQVTTCIELLSPQKVFSNQSINISELDGLSAYKSSAIVRIDVSGPLTPTWPYLGSAQSVTQVSEEEFVSTSHSSELIRNRREAWDKPGTKQEGFTVLNLTNGGRVIWRIEMKSAEMVATDVASASKQFFSAGALHGRRADGGVMIINIAHVESMSFHPGPPQRSGRLLFVERVY